MPLEEILARCLQALEQGETVDGCLARYPAQAAELEPLLRLVGRINQQPKLQLSAAAFGRGRAAVAARARYQQALVAPFNPPKAGQLNLRSTNHRQTAPRRVAPWVHSHPFLSWHRLINVWISLLVLVSLATLTRQIGISLPGSSLYGVKIFGENIQGYLMAAAGQRALWHARQVEQRLAELDQLARQGQSVAASASILAELNEELKMALAASADMASEERNVFLQNWLFQLQNDRALAVTQGGSIETVGRVLATVEAAATMIPTVLPIIETPTDTPASTPTQPPSPTATNTPTVSATPSPTASVTPSATLVRQLVAPAAADTATATQTATAMPTPTAQPDEDNDRPERPTSTPVLAPSPTAVPTTEPTPTATTYVTVEPTALPTLEPTATSSPTATPELSPTPSETPLPIDTPTPGWIDTPTPVETVATEEAPTETVTPAPITPVETPTNIPTEESPTAVPTDVETATPEQETPTSEPTSTGESATATPEPTTAETVEATAIPETPDPAETPNPLATETSAPPESPEPPTPPA